MKQVALMFSGQGSQYAGMGRKLYERYDSVKTVYCESESITGYPIREISFRENDPRINQTKYTQVCMFTLYQAILVLLEERGWHVQTSFGLSLGEYGAYLHQKVFSFEQGLRIVKERARLMDEASKTQHGGMSAVIGLDKEKVEELIAKSHTEVSIANYNTPTQLVVSGSLEGLDAFERLAKNEAKRVIRLKTSGAFHSKWMSQAMTSFQSVLQDIELNEPSGYLYLNTTGMLYHENLKTHMVEQLIKPVRFYQIIDALPSQNITTCIEIGPKRTLCQLVKRIDPTIQTLSIEDDITLEKTLTYMEENDYGL